MSQSTISSRQRVTCQRVWFRSLAASTPSWNIRQLITLRDVSLIRLPSITSHQAYMSVVDTFGPSPARGINAAFERTCALHDKVRGELERLLPDDRRLPSQHHEQDRAALRVLRNHLDKLEDCLRKCRLAEASGIPPEDLLLVSLDKTRKELASACQHSLMVVSSCQGLVHDVLHFCNMSSDTPAQSMVLQPELVRGATTMSSPASAKAWVGEVSTNATIFEGMSPGLSTAGTWGGMDAAGEVNGPVMRKLHSAERSMGDIDGTAGRRKPDQGLPHHYGKQQTGFAVDTGDGHLAARLAASDLDPTRTMHLRHSLDAGFGGARARDSRSMGVPSGSPVGRHLLLQQSQFRDAAGLSSSSGAEQWALTAVRTAPGHMRVVHDPVSMRAERVQDNSVSYTLETTRGPLRRLLGRVGRFVGTAVLAAAMLVGTGIATVWAVEEVGVRVMNSRETCITEDALEPGLPQLRSNRRQGRGKRGRQLEEIPEDGRLQVLLPVFPAPDASIGRG